MRSIPTIIDIVQIDVSEKEAKKVRRQKRFALVQSTYMCRQKKMLSKRRLPFLSTCVYSGQCEGVALFLKLSSNICVASMQANISQERKLNSYSGFCCYIAIKCFCTRTYGKCLYWHLTSCCAVTVCKISRTGNNV